MKLLRVLMTTLAILVILQAEASLRVIVLKMTKSCPGCRLVGVEIKNANLEGADLRNADLRWARLAWVDLRDADLRGADLRYAYFEGVITNNTNFCDAIMQDKTKGQCLK